MAEYSTPACGVVDRQRRVVLRDVAAPKLSALVRTVFALSPKGMIDHLKFRWLIYTRTAAYGHFGRAEFPWEQVDATGELVRAARRL